MLPALAQNWVSAWETAIVYTFEPAFAAVFSFWLLGEKLGVRGWVGAGIVLAAMVLSQISMSNVTIKILPFSQEQENDREDVSEFYQKLGLELVEERLTENPIPYLEMEKTLLPPLSTTRNLETIPNS